MGLVLGQIHSRTKVELIYFYQMVMLRYKFTIQFCQSEEHDSEIAFSICVIFFFCNYHPGKRSSASIKAPSSKLLTLPELVRLCSRVCFVFDWAELISEHVLEKDPDNKSEKNPQ